MGDENVIRPAFGKGGFKPKVVAKDPEPVRTLRPESKSAAKTPERVIDEAEEYEEPTEEELASPEFLRDFKFCFMNMEIMRSFNERGTELTDFVIDVLEYPGFRQESLALRRGVFREHSLEQICELLLCSGKPEWQAKPAWYGAIYIEGHMRQRKLIGSLPKETSD
ncbi:MAG: hypothetical protein KBC38_01315 [Candidatus Pacebacteria bacterium]|nr:hypothetical protein [Candidatus Paceibacterota bacterium]MBP9840274.1 hypothetical protein [Candidatus Paceibacterota bacterium]